MTVPMALVDYIPVILFFISSMILLRDLHHAMAKGSYALLAAGLMIVSIAGCYKATWKLLYALNICDFVALNTSFFPMQSTGFLLGALGMLGFIFFPQKKSPMLVAPIAYTSSMPFVIITVLGTAGIFGGLIKIASKLKQKSAMLIFLVSFICMLGMGYLSSKDFTNPLFNWIGEGVNVVGMTLLFVGVLALHKNGLDEI